MATATATVTFDNFPLGFDRSQHLTEAFGTIAVQAGPATYATGGLALSFAAEALKALNIVPFHVFIDSVAGGAYLYGWNKANNTLQIFADSGGAAGAAPLEELPNGTAIPAGVSGDTIRFVAYFGNAF